MRGTVRVSFQIPEPPVLVPQSQRLRFSKQAGRSRGGAEQRTPIDALNAISHPETQGVGRVKLHRSEWIRDAEKVESEDIGRGFVKAPIRQRNARINRLQQPFEIQEVSTMPGQETRRTMRLGRTHGSVHVPEVGKTAGAVIVELGKGCDKSITLCWSQSISILANTYHYWNRADYRTADGGLDCYVTIVAARTAKLAVDKERNSRAIGWQRQRERVGERPRCALAKSHRSPASRRRAADLHVDSCTSCAGSIGHSDSTGRRRPRHKSRLSIYAVVYCQLYNHRQSLLQGVLTLGQWAYSKFLPSVKG